VESLTSNGQFDQVHATHVDWPSGSSPVAGSGYYLISRKRTSRAMRVDKEP